MSATPQLLDPAYFQRLPLPEQLRALSATNAAAPSNVVQMPSPGLQRLPSPDAPTASPVTSMGGDGGLQRLQAPSAPNAQPNQLLTDQGELNRMRNSGSGIDQIGQTVDAQGNRSGHPGFWGTLGKVGATVGDDLLRLVAPKLEQMIPGGYGHHQQQMGLQQGYVNSDLANAESAGKLQQQQAQLGLTGAQADYFQARPEIEQSKIDQKQTAVQQRVGQAAAAKGQKVSWDENGIPTFTDDTESEAFHDHQALSAMHQATADKNKVLTENADHKFIPGTPQYEEWHTKLLQADQRMKLAMQGLTLRAQGLDLRRQNTNAALYGTDNAGNALPGAAQIAGDDGGTTTVGSRNATNAIKQQKTVASFNDLTGSVSHLRNAIKAYESEGGDMSDATLAQAASDPTSVIGKVINGKLVTGGLSPAALTLLNAQRQTMEQAGILRSTTGGTASEAGAQRILAVVPQFGADTNKSAYSKLDEQEQVLGRLKPGQTQVAGGVHVAGGHPAHSGQISVTAPDGSIHQFANKQQADTFKKLAGIN